MDRTEKLAALSGLVNTFRTNLDEYKQTGYKEAKVRRDFIDTFFELLDWDIANKSGKSEQYRDVIIEDTIEISGAQKAPDYCFKIGKERKFFVEAKKPSVDVKDDIDPAYQVRRYGHTANLSLSILTDFEEFAVYDTRIKPGKHDKAGVARIFYCTFEDYEKQFDFIYNTFSKEAVEKGSFDKYASDSSTKRGSESVDKGLLSLIEGFRLDLAKNIAKLNKKLDLYQLNAVVTKIIDRIIFLRIAEDRDVERYGTLLKAATGEIDTGLVNKENTGATGTINTGSRPRALSHGGKTGSTGPRPRVYKNIREIFIAANEKYNSELFRANETIDDADIDDDVLKDIITALYYPDCPYELSVLPLEILGNIYEQFLGKTIRLTESHLAKVEEKPEVRKAGGVYYTPQYIVEYIVKNTVGEKLNAGNIDTGTVNKTNTGSTGDTITGSVNITDTGSRPRALSDDSKTERTGLQPRVPMTPEDASKMRICDPACGSGSFLIGAYDYLLEWHYKYYMQELNAPLSPQPPFPSEKGKGEHKTPILDKALKEKRIYKYSKGYRLTIEEKKRILLNNIYGVDIDAQAVEVTKLSLVLKILENENAESAGTLLSYSAEKMLPDLSNNIKCGNSLIGSDFYKDKQMDMFDAAEMRKVNAFDWEKEFPTIFAAGGFDVVIGNPPYVRQEMLGEFKPYFEEKYKVYHGMADLYAYFIERGINLLNKTGVYSIIVANKWMRANYGKPLRDFLKASGLREIIDFGDLPVFESATTYPCILTMGKQQDDGTRAHEPLFSAVNISSLDFNDLSDFLADKRFNVSIKSLGDEGWTLVDERSQKVLDKIRSSGMTLGKYVQGKIYYGIKTGLNEAFVIDEETKKKLIKEDKKSAEIIKPFLAGRDVKRYEPLNAEKYLLFIPKGFTKKHSESNKAWSWFESTYPAVAGHLLPFQKQAEKRSDQGDFWWELRACDYYDEIEQAKIIFPDISLNGDFTYDNNGCYGANTIYFIPADDKILLGILNSLLIRFYFRHTLAVFRGGYLRYFTQNLLELPLPINLSMTGKDEHIVDQMLAAQKEYHAAKESDKAILKQKIDAIDAQIDALVYELYGLTQEEIAIVEGKTK